MVKYEDVLADFTRRAEVEGWSVNRAEVERMAQSQTDYINQPPVEVVEPFDIWWEGYSKNFTSAITTKSFYEVARASWLAAIDWYADDNYAD